jgi:hypothetical protein
MSPTGEPANELRGDRLDELASQRAMAFGPNAVDTRARLDDLAGGVGRTRSRRVILSSIPSSVIDATTRPAPDVSAIVTEMGTGFSG